MAKKTKTAEPQTPDNPDDFFAESLEDRLHNVKRHRHLPLLVLFALIGFFLASTAGITFTILPVLLDLRVRNDLVSRALVFSASVLGLLYCLIHLAGSRTHYTVTQPGPPWLYGNHLHTLALLLARVALGVWISAIITTSLLVSRIGLRLDTSLAEQSIYLNLIISAVAFFSLVCLLYCVEVSKTPFKTILLSKRSFLHGRRQLMAPSDADLSVSQRASLMKAEAIAELDGAVVDGGELDGTEYRGTRYAGKKRQTVGSARASKLEKMIQDSQRFDFVSSVAQPTYRVSVEAISAPELVHVRHSLVRVRQRSLSQSRSASRPGSTVEWQPPRSMPPPPPPPPAKDPRPKPTGLHRPTSSASTIDWRPPYPVPPPPPIPQSDDTWTAPPGSSRPTSSASTVDWRPPFPRTKSAYLAQFQPASAESNRPTDARLSRTPSVPNLRASTATVGLQRRPSMPAMRLSIMPPTQQVRPDSNAPRVMQRTPSVPVLRTSTAAVSLPRRPSVPSMRLSVMPPNQPRQPLRRPQSIKRKALPDSSKILASLAERAMARRAAKSIDEERGEAVNSELMLPFQGTDSQPTITGLSELPKRGQATALDTRTLLSVNAPSPAIISPYQLGPYTDPGNPFEDPRSSGESQASQSLLAAFPIPVSHFDVDSTSESEAGTEDAQQSRRSSWSSALPQSPQAPVSVPISPSKDPDELFLTPPSQSPQPPRQVSGPRQQSESPSPRLSPVDTSPVPPIDPGVRGPSRTAKSQGLSRTQLRLRKQAMRAANSNLQYSKSVSNFSRPIRGGGTEVPERQRSASDPRPPSMSMSMSMGTITLTGKPRAEDGDTRQPTSPVSTVGSLMDVRRVSKRTSNAPNGRQYALQATRTSRPVSPTSILLLRQKLAQAGV